MMMKLNKLMIAALSLAVIATSCSQNSMMDKPSGVEVTLSAAIENDAETRTGYEGLEFSWRTGDELKVLNNGGESVFALDPASNGNSGGVFTGTIANPSGFVYAAYHPKMNEVSFSGTTVAFTMPTSQLQKYQTKDGVDIPYVSSLGEYAFMVGKSKNELNSEEGTNPSINMKMQQVAAVIDFNFTNLPTNKAINSLTLFADYDIPVNVTVDANDANIATNYTATGAARTMSVSLMTGSNVDGFTSTTGSLTIRLAVIKHTAKVGSKWEVALNFDDDVKVSAFTFEASKMLHDGTKYDVNIDYSSMTAATNHYIDEYGINHGPGIVIGDNTWAPVNCGYHATTNKYGKLYQWGRKYGSGYSNSANNSGINSNDAAATVQGRTASTKIDASAGIASSVVNDEANKLNYYTTASGKDWNSTPQAAWDAASDPCPEGWRVPDYTGEMNTFVSSTKNVYVTDYVGGVYTTATAGTLYTSGSESIFLPAAGWISHSRSFSESGVRASASYYWSDYPKSDNLKVSFYVKLVEGSVLKGSSASTSKSCAMPIRCIKE